MHRAAGTAEEDPMRHALRSIQARWICSFPKLPYAPHTFEGCKEVSNIARFCSVIIGGGRPRSVITIVSGRPCTTIIVNTGV